MARVRNLDPGFFTNEELVELPFEFRLLFAGLWTLADREGRLEDRPKRIRMELFPCDAVDCDAGLQALHDAGLVVRYSVDGAAYLWIPKFHDHQRPHPRETPSRIPAFQGAPQAGQGRAEPAEQDPEGEPKANPRQTQGEPRCAKGETRLPDSRTLGLSEKDTHTPRASPVDLAVAFRQSGVEANSANPEVIALAEQGVTAETVAAACEEARRRKPGERLPVAYVARVLESWARRAAGTRANGAQAPPAGLPASKGAAFLAALDRATAPAQQQTAEVIDVAATATRTARLGR